MNNEDVTKQMEELGFKYNPKMDLYCGNGVAYAPHQAAFLCRTIRDKVEEARKEPCPSCNGIGEYHDPTGEYRGECNACNGTGMSDLFTQHQLDQAVQEARKDQIHKDLGGYSYTMPIKSVRTRNTAFKLYAVKFFNSKIKERRERALDHLKNGGSK